MKILFPCCFALGLDGVLMPGTVIEYFTIYLWSSVITFEIKVQMKKMNFNPCITDTLSMQFMLCKIYTRFQQVSNNNQSMKLCFKKTKKPNKTENLKNWSFKWFLIFMSLVQSYISLNLWTFLNLSVRLFVASTEHFVCVCFMTLLLRLRCSFEVYYIRNMNKKHAASFDESKFSDFMAF